MPPRATPHLLAAALACLALLATSCDRASGDGAASRASAAGSAAGPTVRVAIKVVKGGYEPSEVHLKQGQRGILAFTRVSDSECTNAVRMPWMKEAVDLPLNETVEIPVDTSKAGTFSYSCWMSMVFGRVIIDPP